MDHRKNYFGNLLLEFCKYNNMFICNSRMCNDKGVGKFTSKDASVVDYVIGSISFLKLVQKFSVLDSSKLFSDIHTPLSLKVTCAEKPNDVTFRFEHLNCFLACLHSSSNHGLDLLVSLRIFFALVYVPKVDFAELVSKLHIFSSIRKHRKKTEIK
jgi:hypothetical protein